VAKTKTQEANTADHNGITVLMADSDLAFLKEYTVCFTRSKYNFVTARDSQEFITNFGASKPDAIIMDITLKDLKTENLIKILRKRGYQKPIFIISSKLNKPLIETFKKLKVDGFFPKTVSPHQVEKKLRECIKSHIAVKSRVVNNKQWPPLTALIMTENTNIIEKPELIISKEFIDEFSLRIFCKKGFQESVALIKKPDSNIKIIMVDSAKEQKIQEMIRLLKIIESKLRIPVFFFSDNFSMKLKGVLNAVGFLNLYTRSSFSTQDFKNKFKAALGGASDKKSKEASGRLQNIMKELKAVKSLPPMPDIYLKIEKLSRDTNATSKHYADILELDPSITARLLRLSNSAYYSFKRKIKSVKDTVTLMGTREILSLVRLACITGSIKTKPDVEVAVKQVWEHSATCAITAKLLYEVTDIAKTEELGDELFICGIIHDLGKIVLWSLFPEYYMTFVMNPEVGDYPTSEEEVKFLGVSHSDVGRTLAEHWKLPEQLSDAITFHHNPSHKPDSEQAVMVHLADIIAQRVMNQFDEGNEPQFDKKILKSINYTSEQLIELATELEPKIKENIQVVVKMITG
jgi:HD-like signal output (HDOD) protein/DNA-binding NarL/FixJ family response regulator